MCGHHGSQSAALSRPAVSSAVGRLAPISFRDSGRVNIPLRNAQLDHACPEQVVHVECAYYTSTLVKRQDAVDPETFHVLNSFRGKPVGPYRVRTAGHDLRNRGGAYVDTLLERSSKIAICARVTENSGQ